MPRRRITAASFQDRDAARPLLWNLHRACRRIRLVRADAACTGSRLAGLTATLKTIRCILAKRDPHARGRCRCITLLLGRSPDHIPKLRLAHRVGVICADQAAEVTIAVDVVDIQVGVFARGSMQKHRLAPGVRR